jgi:hypothetical protein
MAAIAILIIVLTHLAIDFIKVRSRDNLIAFTLDQLTHIAIIAGITEAWPGLASRGYWSTMSGDQQALYYTILVYISGLIVAVPLGGIVIKKLINPFVPSDLRAATRQTGSNPQQAPVQAGRYIGWLERTLTFAFIIAKQPEGVGFLLAAKSVLRIGDLKDESERHHAEYIIIGTFLSFGWAMIVTFGTAAAASHWGNWGN